MNIFYNYVSTINKLHSFRDLFEVLSINYKLQFWTKTVNLLKLIYHTISSYNM